MTLSIQEIREAAIFSHDTYMCDNRRFKYDYQDQSICIKKFYDKMIIAFKGTVSYDQWIINLMCNMTKGVHTGFLQQFHLYIDVILSNIKDFNGLIYVTGHSLGGALSTLTYLMLKERNLNVKCITFGSPYISDCSYFSKHDVSELYNIVNKCDLIPRIIPYLSSICNIDTTYCPLGNYIEIDNNKLSPISHYQLRDLTRWIDKPLVANLYSTYHYHSIDMYMRSLFTIDCN